MQINNCANIYLKFGCWKRPCPSPPGWPALLPQYIPSHCNPQQSLYCKPQPRPTTRIMLCRAGQKKAAELRTRALRLLLTYCAILDRFSLPLWPSAPSSAKRETRHCCHRIPVKADWTNVYWMFSMCQITCYTMRCNTACDTIYKEPSVSWPKRTKRQEITSTMWQEL